jgi:hypothetical protein
MGGAARARREPLSRRVSFPNPGLHAAWRKARRMARPSDSTQPPLEMLDGVFVRADGDFAGEVEIMRAFVRLRRILADNAGLARRLDELEKKCDVPFRHFIPLSVDPFLFPAAF